MKRAVPAVELETSSAHLKIFFDAFFLLRVTRVNRREGHEIVWICFRNLNDFKIILSLADEAGSAQNRGLGTSNYHRPYNIIALHGL